MTLISDLPNWILLSIHPPFNLSTSQIPSTHNIGLYHDDVIKSKHFPRYWPFARGIHRSPVNSPHKGQWRGALMFSLNWAWINGWVKNPEAGDLRRYRAHYDVIVMHGCESDHRTNLICVIAKFVLYSYVKLATVFP